MELGLSYNLTNIVTYRPVTRFILFTGWWNYSLDFNTAFSISQELQFDVSNKISKSYCNKTETIWNLFKGKKHFSVKWFAIDCIHFETAFWWMGISRYGSFAISVREFKTAEMYSRNFINIIIKLSSIKLKYVQAEHAVTTHCRRPNWNDWMFMRN